MTAVVPALQTCPHCGLIHQTTCPRIKSIEYHPNGQIARLEFHSPPSMLTNPEAYRWLGQDKQ